MPIRLLGENYVAFRAEDGRVGFLDERCPHRRASLVLARLDGNCLQCIYHGWKIDVSGCVVDAPTQLVRPERFAARASPSTTSRSTRPAASRGCGSAAATRRRSPTCPFADAALLLPLPVARARATGSRASRAPSTPSTSGCCTRRGSERRPRWPSTPTSRFALDQPPTYETEAAPYGMRAAALRTTSDGGTYVRITEHLMPFVTVVPVGQAQPRSGSVFVISPVDDTHHLLFFGYFGDTPHSAKRPDEICMEGPGYEPDPHDYTRFRGNRDDRWGQDRALMNEGHWTGFGRSLLEEDVVIQTSMGPILDRTKEHLSSSDVAVAHARRMLLDALAAVERGELPPGSVRSPEPVRLPNPLEALLRDGDRWEDLTLDPVTP